MGCAPSHDQQDNTRSPGKKQTSIVPSSALKGTESTVTQSTSSASINTPNGTQRIAVSPKLHPVAVTSGIDSHGQIGDEFDINPTTNLFYGDPSTIDASILDVADDHNYQLYVKRQQHFDLKLRKLYEKTQKLQRLPIDRKHITYVRPFLSSTFKDFNTERNHCFATSFPRLEKLCADRGVFFAPLDLRWGVTSEQSGSGQVIKLCLEEIDRSRPYFVCSLGFRNGWSLYPTDDPNDQYVKLLQNTFEISEQMFPWVKQCRDRSVTELEILHGALNNPAACPRTYFLFRNMEFLQNCIPANERKIYIETGQAEIALMKLKIRIIQAGYHIQWFSNPQEMGDLLEKSMAADIEVDFPVQQLTPLEHELKDHTAFGDMRTRIFVDGEHYYNALDQYLLGNSNAPFVLTGPSGSGKSALIANWYKRVVDKQQQNEYAGAKREQKKQKVLQRMATFTSPNQNTRALNPYASTVGSNNDMTPAEPLDWNIAHVQCWFVGSSSDSTQPGPLLRWSTSAFATAYPDTDLTIAQDPKKVISEYNDWLEAAAANTPLLIIIDGLDQLATDDDQSLSWLPTTWPQNVRVVLSCTDDSIAYRTLLHEYHYPSQHVDLLSDETCLGLLRTFLGSYGKALDTSQEQMILQCSRTRNPLYLITFLQEVRVFGSFEQLNKRFEHYLIAANVAEMFAKVIERLEDDFNPATPGLVQYTLLYLMTARRGLTEPELKGCLEIIIASQPMAVTKTESTDNAVVKTFPNLEFSALMLRLDQQLVEQSGLRKFSHNYLKQAVRDRYFKSTQSHKNPLYSGNELFHTAMNEQQCHLQLAKYFSSTVLNQRKVEEYPWHLWQVLQYYISTQQHKHYSMDNNSSDEQTPGQLEVLQQQLIDCISDLPTFSLLVQIHHLDLHKYWLTIESLTTNKDIVTQCYTRQLQVYYKELKPTPSEYAQKSEEVGTFLTSTDRYFGAEIFLDQALEIYEKVPQNEQQVERILTKKANLLYRLGRFDEALPIYQRALEIVETLEAEEKASMTTVTSLKGTSTSIRRSVLMTSIAGLLKEQGKYSESKPLYERSLADKIALLGKSHPVVAISMSNLADLYLRMFDPQNALPLYTDALKIMELEHGKSHPTVATIVSSLASCHLQQKNFGAAIALYERAKRIKEEMLGKNHISVAVVLNNLAAAYHAQGNHDQAIKLYDRSLNIRRNATVGRDQSPLVPTIVNLALVYVAESKYAVALSYYQQALQLLENTHGAKSYELVAVLRNIASVHVTQKQYNDAITIYQRILLIQEHNNQNDGVPFAQTYHHIGMCYQSLNDFINALKNHLQELWILQRKFGLLDARVADVLIILGVVYVSSGREEDGKLSFRRCYAIRSKLYGPDHESCAEAKEWVEDLMDDDGDEDGESGEKNTPIDWSLSVDQIADPQPMPLPPKPSTPARSVMHIRKPSVIQIGRAKGPAMIAENGYPAPSSPTVDLSTATALKDVTNSPGETSSQKKVTNSIKLAPITIMKKQPVVES